MGYQIWNKQDDLYPPMGGKITAAEMLAKYGWAQNPNAKVVISTGAVNCGVFLQYDMLLDQKLNEGMEVPEGATDEEIVNLIWEWERRTPPPPDLSDEVLMASAALIMS
jgi:hypothetical protein